jgi:hypothetical protein
MAKSKLPAREMARQERERARSLEDRKKKAAQLQQRAQHGAVDLPQEATAKPVAEGNPARKRP